jgi:hypothetical protein
VGPCRLDDKLRPAALNLLGGIKAREGFAENLISPITRKPLGANVPTRHASTRIEHADGVVLGVFDKKADGVISTVRC